MRYGSQRLRLLSVLFGLLGLAGCADANEKSAVETSGGRDESEGASSPEDPIAGDGDGDGDGDSDAVGDDGSSAPPVGVEPGEGTSGQAGLLTAGAWDDNRNYEHFEAYRKSLENLTGKLGLSDAERAAAHEAFAGDREPNKTLDVSLVIDTTGSMGDEITYLQTELVAISEAIEKSYPKAEQRWSLVVYRDDGDEYVTRSFDFDSDTSSFRTDLAAQGAGGGGDFPEAPEAAFEALTQLSWREAEDTARLAFWVADAPHHEDRAQKLTTALRAARDLDIHVYPVASSGIDEITELTMRSAAQLTGGRYLFLTDDSGVGGEHKEPTIPCYFVTRLDKAIVRMIDVELSGTYREPATADIIRRSGDMEDGACKLESGQTVEAF